MPAERIGTLVVGAGQAGIAMSEHLRGSGLSHLVLERHRVAERWRSERWDSLVANGPAWHDRFPGMAFPDADRDAFVSKDEVAASFAAYARMIEAPIRCGVEVTQVERVAGRAGFRVQTSDGVIEAGNVVIATGPFRPPSSPPSCRRPAGCCRCIPAPIATPGDCPTARCWSSAPDRPGRRSRTSTEP